MACEVVKILSNLFYQKNYHCITDAKSGQYAMLIALVVLHVFYTLCYLISFYRYINIKIDILYIFACKPFDSALPDIMPKGCFHSCQRYFGPCENLKVFSPCRGCLDNEGRCIIF